MITLWTEEFDRKMRTADALQEQYKQELKEASVRGDRQAAEVAKAKIETLRQVRRIYG